MYSVETLEKGIEKCKENIVVFEEAIEKERNTIKEYRGMIETLIEKARKEKEALNNIHIEVE